MKLGGGSVGLRGVGGATEDEGDHRNTLYACVSKLKIFLLTKSECKCCILSALGLGDLDFRLFCVGIS